MKTIIICNVLTVALLLVLAFSLYGSNVSSSYTGHRNFLANLSGYYIALIFLVGIGLIVLSHTDPKRGLLWGALPIVFAVVFYLISVGSAIVNSNAGTTTAREEKKAYVPNNIDAQLAKLQKNYVASNTGEDFITIDKQYGVLLNVVESRGKYMIKPVGIIRGKNLEIKGSEDYSNFPPAVLQNYKDSEGKTLSENYNLMYVLEQDQAPYHLDRFPDKVIY